MEQFLRPNNSRISHKIVDGEAVLIDLSNGVYFSLPSVGGFVWAMIDGGYGLEAIVDAVATQYAVDKETAKKDVEALAARLLEENIVVGSESSEAKGTSGAEIPSPAEAYSVPTLNKFDDMVDLFALDPPLPELSKLKPLS